MDNNGHFDPAARYVVFINKRINDKIIANFGAGVLYRWRKEDDFSGIQFFRTGPGIIYNISEKHRLNFSYFVSGTNTGTNWTWTGITFIQLIININKGYKYLPAKYVNF